MDQQALELIRTRRLELHEQLVDILGTADESESRVYFQPPESVKMKYPAIVYNRDGGRVIHADDGSYIWRPGYLVTVIDPDPDSIIAVTILSRFAMASLDRNYTADNLHHEVLKIYY